LYNKIDSVSATIAIIINIIELFFEDSSLTNSEVIQLRILTVVLTLQYLMLEFQLNRKMLEERVILTAQDGK
jgi:hypothetical protein